MLAGGKACSCRRSQTLPRHVAFAPRAYRKANARDVARLQAQAAATLEEAVPKKAGKIYADAAIDEDLVEEYGVVGPNPPSGRSAGIVMHPTSLPGPYGSGEMGEEAFKFVDWLASAGMTAWQVLPLVPPDEEYFSPYSGIDALCGNPLLISLDKLVEDGLLDTGQYYGPKILVTASTILLCQRQMTSRSAAADLPKTIPVADADFLAIAKTKNPLLNKAGQRLMSDAKFDSMRESVSEFRRDNAWVEEAALFDVIRRQDGMDVAWWDWPADVRDRDEATLSKLRKEHSRSIDVFVAIQYIFSEQWTAVKNYANEQGIKIVGDMPIYVGGQSADVWANPTLFALGPNKAPEMVSGVPPDAFSDTGQLWGSPLYDWQAHDAEGYKWWAQRLGRAAQVYDITRIDHFRAFTGYWAVPATAETAMTGSWRKGPGKALFDGIASRLGDAAPEIMAEDLGVITPDVTALRKEIGAPGMVVLQFAWGGGTDNTHLPHKHYANCFVYPGTHDNETTVGWWEGSAQPKEKQYLKDYLKTDGENIAWVFIQESMKSVAATCMIMMQDVMSLDNTHRMNSPGKAAGNWGWRIGESSIWDSLSAEASKLRKLAVMYDRFKEPEVPEVSDSESESESYSIGDGLMAAMTSEILDGDASQDLD